MIKKYFDSINWKAWTINLVINTLSTVIAAFGISCYYACGLGADPVSVIVDGQHALMNLSYGTISTINNAIWVVMFLLLMRERLGPGTIITTLISGFFIDLANSIVMPAFPVETTPLLVKIVILAIGAVVFGIGTALSISTNMGVGTWSFLPLYLEKVTPLKINVTQMITDAICLAVGWMLGGIVGLGTIVGVLSTGPIIDLTMKLTQPMFDKIGPNYKE